MAQYDTAFHARLSTDERALSRIKSDLDNTVQERDKTRLLIEELLRKVVEADADIADLSAQRDLLSTSIQRRRATLPQRPLPALPLEILGMIFKYSCVLYGRSLAGELQPVRCSQVCRQWRSAALNMASLWTHIVVDYIPRGAIAAGVRWRRLVQHRLLLSGACALHVNIAVARVNLEMLPTYYRDILSDLMGHCSRWRDLTIHGYVFDGGHWDILALLRCRTPLLESVTFSFTDPCPFKYTLETLPTYLPHAPELKQARFVNVPVAFNRGRVSNVDGQAVLKAVSLALSEDGYDLAEFKATVTSFPALTTLEIGCSDCHAPEMTTLSELPIRLPALQTLLLGRGEVYDLDPAYYRSFSLVLDALDAPKLRRLELGPALLDCAQGLLRRSAGTLQELQFRDGYLDSAQPVRAIASLHALQKISFEWTGLSHEFICALSDSSTLVDAVIWPKLERIVLTMHGSDFDEVLHFLRLRYPLDASCAAPCALLEVEGHNINSLVVAEIRHILDSERERRGYEI